MKNGDQTNLRGKDENEYTTESRPAGTRFTGARTKWDRMTAAGGEE
jgi:hypothetical protein